ncbi:hypothetical protein K458DRAFT_396782 [Lentithecium fluviatile CBS 122367]|uniref:Uncharacterized protein n=1 Tax=Lentithecium fluviatile CBS 122367 TaxID=1168545 RepID=A0A6G1IF09_9PLEO|nr:hypothetical protein K458DRAFT_396782 [Lentithecium fluviatile CBS 122367]
MSVHEATKPVEVARASPPAPLSSLPSSLFTPLHQSAFTCIFPFTGRAHSKATQPCLLAHLPPPVTLLLFPPNSGIASTNTSSWQAPTDCGSPSPKSPKRLIFPAGQIDPYTLPAPFQDDDIQDPDEGPVALNQPQYVRRQPHSETQNLNSRRTRNSSSRHSGSGTCSHGSCQYCFNETK